MVKTIEKRGNPNFKIPSKNPGLKAQFKSIGDVEEKMHKKTFAVKMPMSAAAKLLKLDTKSRTVFMRQALLEALDKLEV
jgi:hypothetical protein